MGSSIHSPRRGRAHGRCCTEVPQSHPDLAPNSAHRRETFLMGPSAVHRPHGPSRCLVDLEILAVMFKRRGDGRENTIHMGQGGRNRLNQWHYSLSCRCLCDTPRKVQHHSRNNARGRDTGRVTQVGNLGRIFRSRDVTLLSPQRGVVQQVALVAI